jgi:hypothetical protein
MIAEEPGRIGSVVAVGEAVVEVMVEVGGGR